MNREPLSIPCPPADELERFVTGDSPDPVVRAHIATCGACGSAADRIRKNNEFLAGFLKSNPASRPDQLHEAILRAVPGHELIREIHRGGQGIVYQAVQTSTRRTVAVKVLREGPFAGLADKARFEREVHILAQLKHPNIVAIHDSGQTAGHFYFVMDYIDGRPLDEYALPTVDETPLGSPSRPPRKGRKAIDPKATLQLFAIVCDAVNAAHLLGFIHRDLKPSNILIDADGQPHILDFGLARTAATDLDATAMTVTGQFVGSLPWASPEQAEGIPSKIDLRTDVYSLGVILYQILTGRFPYSVVGSMRDVVEEILHAEPTRPSTVHRRVDNEIETIALKCLQKDRERRYQTAGELARDIRLYLTGEPIEAKRDSFGYMVRKQLRRYRVPVVIAAAFVLLITAGLFTSVSFWRDAVVERDRARAAESVQARLREQAETSAESTRKEAAKSTAVNKFLQDMLASADPNKVPGKEITVRQVLDEAAKKLDAGDLTDQPEVAGAVRTTLGSTYESLGLLDEAEAHLRAALQANIRAYGGEHAEVVQTLAGIGIVLNEQGALDEAESTVREALQLARRLHGPEHVDVALVLHCLAIVLRDKGNLPEAEPLYRESLAMRRKLLGDDHLDVAQSLNSLSLVLQDKGESLEGEALSREALAIRRRHLGDEHPIVAGNMNNLAFLVQMNGDRTGAMELYRQALELRRKALGPDHPDVAQALHNIAVVLHNNGDYAAAESYYRDALVIWRKTYGDDHLQVARCLQHYGLSVTDLNRFTEAESIFRDSLRIRKEKLPADHLDVAVTLASLAFALEREQRYAEAEPLIREALAIRQAKLPPDHVLHFAGKSILGAVLTGLGRYEEAEPLLVQSFERVRDDPKIPLHRKEKYLERVVALYDLWGRSDDAIRYRALHADPATASGQPPP